MKAASFSSIPAPSPSLLRFLRSQVEQPNFFSSSNLYNAASLAPSAHRCCSRTRRNSVAEPKPTSTLSKPVPEALRTSLWPLDQRWPPSKPDTSSTSLAPCQPPPVPLLRRPAAALPFGARHISTSRSNWVPFWQRWHFRTTKAARPLQPNDLPPRSSFLDESTGGSLGRITKPANDLRLRCTEFDENGNVTLVNGELKKSELIAKYGLLPRDLRKIDSSLLPHILTRPSAILINLLHIRCLIRHDCVLVFDIYGSTDTYNKSLFIYDLEGKLRLKERTAAGGLPYEFRALEAVLVSVTSGLEGEFEGVRDPVVRVLRELEEDIDRDKLRHLLIYSKKLGTFEQKARLVRDAIDDLLEADDDLASMYLTEKAQGKVREEDDHTEVEMLLESYHKVCDEIVQASGNLVSNIRNTEEIVKAILDANRNSLMLLDLKFTIGTLGIAAGTFVAALYGMNLKNFIEESDLGFPLVSLACGVFTVIAVIYGLRKLRKVQRLSMWGEGGSLDQGGVGKGRGGRGSWNDVLGSGDGLGGMGRTEMELERVRKLKEEQRRFKVEEIEGGPVVAIKR
ncbi:magnesium ion transporter [Elasticomyces elasticus]|nr:magnesium ion transporter [Elasticomyces elasticus]